MTEAIGRVQRTSQYPCRFHQNIGCKISQKYKQETICKLKRNDILIIFYQPRWSCCAEVVFCLSFLKFKKKLLKNQGDNQTNLFTYESERLSRTNRYVMVFLNVNLLLRRAAMDIRLNATPVTLKNVMTCFLRNSVSVDNHSGCVDISFITATTAFYSLMICAYI